MRHTLHKHSLTALVAVGVLSLTNISALAAKLAAPSKVRNNPSPARP